MSKSWRLTKRIEGGVHRVCHKGHTDHCYGCVDRTTCNHDIFERLAQYEDTGRLPEMVGCVFDEVVRKLPRFPEESRKGFWVNGSDEIMCKSKETATLVADFFEEMGYDIMHIYLYDNESDPYYGWWAVYVDGQ